MILRPSSPPRLPRSGRPRPGALALLLVLLLPTVATGATPDDPAAVENARTDTSASAPAREVEGSRASSRSDRGDDSDRGVTLDAITIEGEIDVPQVLFITSRDHLRGGDLLHRVYLADPVGLAWTPAPAVVVDATAARPALVLPPRPVATTPAAVGHHERDDTAPHPRTRSQER